MTNVQFQDDAGIPLYDRLEAPKRALIGFLIDKEVVKDEKQANLVLVGVILVCVAVTIGVIVYSKSSTPASKPYSATDIQQMKNLPPLK